VKEVYGFSPTCRNGWNELTMKRPQVYKLLETHLPDLHLRTQCVTARNMASAILHQPMNPNDSFYTDIIPHLEEAAFGDPRNSFPSIPPSMFPCMHYNSIPMPMGRLVPSAPTTGMDIQFPPVPNFHSPVAPLHQVAEPTSTPFSTLLAPWYIAAPASSAPNITYYTE